MSDKKSVIESVEDKIKRAAKDVEALADKVSADEEPLQFETDDTSPKADKLPSAKNSK